jgi:hypothetical protein
MFCGAVFLALPATVASRTRSGRFLGMPLTSLLLFLASELDRPKIEPSREKRLFFFSGSGVPGVLDVPAEVDERCIFLSVLPLALPPDISLAFCAADVD